MFLFLLNSGEDPLRLKDEGVPLPDCDESVTETAAVVALEKVTLLSLVVDEELTLVPREGLRYVVSRPRMCLALESSVSAYEYFRDPFTAVAWPFLDRTFLMLKLSPDFSGRYTIQLSSCLLTVCLIASVSNPQQLVQTNSHSARHEDCVFSILRTIIG